VVLVYVLLGDTESRSRGVSWVAGVDGVKYKGGRLWPWKCFLRKLGVQPRLRVTGPPLVPSTCAPRTSHSPWLSAA
jgi:hypothetical protein